MAKRETRNLKLETIAHLCDVFRRRLKALLLQAGVCRVLILAVVLLPPLLVLDWWLHLASVWRLLLLASYLGILGVTAWWTLIAPLSRPWRNEEVLAYLDSVLPKGQGMLLELSELSRGQDIQEAETPLGRRLMDEAIAALAPLAAQAERSETLHRGRALWWAKLAALACAVGALLAASSWEHACIGCARFFNPFCVTRWPHKTTIALEEPASGWTIPRSESFTVKGTVTGVVPAQVTVVYRGKSAGYWIKDKVGVRPDGSGMEYTFPEVREPVDFCVVGGDYTTDEYRIEILERPYLTKVMAHYEYPEYAGIPNRAVESGQLVGLEGTRVRLAFECSMPLLKAVFRLSGHPPEELPCATAALPCRFEKALLLEADGSYSVELHEEHGYRESKPEKFDIRVVPDNPPEVELLSPGRNLVATGRACVEVAFRATDDFGLAKIEFLHRIGEGKLTPLSDRITGPLPPHPALSPVGRGLKSFAGRFRWELRKMDLPKSGVLQYCVRAQDVNPTGRGVRETGLLEIKLVKPTEFHYEIFSQAKRIEAEARLAWEKQLEAWEQGIRWTREGTGKEDDPVWQGMGEKQEAAVRAAGAIEGFLRELCEQYEQNDMSREFMAGRLAAITDLLRRVNKEEHPRIAEGLQKSRAATAADAAEEKSAARRAAALAQIADHQKMAALLLERMLRHLFDWRDLQSALIAASLLHEEQAEVLGTTETVAPKSVGADLADLPDDVVDQLLTLGKRQETLYDGETRLEKEIEFQILRAELQKRLGLLGPLKTAYRVLRENRVNDNLKLAASLIQNNQAFQIVKNQQMALRALDVVRGGLLETGQKTDPEPPLTLAMTPSRILDVNPRLSPEVAKDISQPPPEGAATESGEVSPEKLVSNLPLGSDPVTLAINVAWEAEDAVLKKTRYLAGNNSPAEMPRYVRLKQNVLIEKQDSALVLVDLAVKEAEKDFRFSIFDFGLEGEPKSSLAAPPSPPANPIPTSRDKIQNPESFVASMLKGAREEFQQSQKLLNDGRFGEGTQQIQADAMWTLDDLQHLFIPVQKSLAESADENRKRGGLDAHNRQFLLRDKDLDAAVAAAEGLNRAYVTERDIVRKVARFSKSAAKDPVLAAVEKANRARAGAAQKQAAGVLQEALRQLKLVSEEAAAGIPRRALGPLGLGTTGVPPVETHDRDGRATFVAFADEVLSGAKDEELKTSLGGLVGLLEQSLEDLKQALGERVRPKPKDEAVAVSPAKTVTLEEWEKMHSREALQEKLKATSKLPPEVRDIMLRALSRDLPPKYRDLLRAYYGSFTDQEEMK